MLLHHSAAGSEGNSLKKKKCYSHFFFILIIIIIIIIILQNLKEVKTSRDGLRKILWFLGIGRNAVVVIICAGISYYFETQQDGAPFLLTGHIEKGFPRVEPPAFSYVQGNSTVTFSEMFVNLGTGTIIVPLISLIGNVAIAKAFCKFRSRDAIFFCHVYCQTRIGQ